MNRFRDIDTCPLNEVCRVNLDKCHSTRYEFCLIYREKLLRSLTRTRESDIKEGDKNE